MNHNYNMTLKSLSQVILFWVRVLNPQHKFNMPRKNVNHFLLTIAPSLGLILLLKMLPAFSE